MDKFFKASQEMKEADSSYFTDEGYEKCISVLTKHMNSHPFTIVVKRNGKDELVDRLSYHFERSNWLIFGESSENGEFKPVSVPFLKYEIGKKRAQYAIIMCPQGPKRTKLDIHLVQAKSWRPQYIFTLMKCTNSILEMAGYTIKEAHNFDKYVTSPSFLYLVVYEKMVGNPNTKMEEELPLVPKCRKRFFTDDKLGMIPVGIAIAKMDPWSKYKQDQFVIYYKTGKGELFTELTETSRRDNCPAPIQSRHYCYNIFITDEQATTLLSMLADRHPPCHLEHDTVLPILFLERLIDEVCELDQ